jgi:hypothetical protein
VNFLPQSLQHRICRVPSCFVRLRPFRIECDDPQCMQTGGLPLPMLITSGDLRGTQLYKGMPPHRSADSLAVCSPRGPLPEHRERSLCVGGWMRVKRWRAPKGPCPRHRSEVSAREAETGVYAYSSLAVEHVAARRGKRRFLQHRIRLRRESVQFTRQLPFSESTFLPFLFLSILKTYI